MKEEEEGKGERRKSSRGSRRCMRLEMKGKEKKHKRK
jgi:hypothetical protein